MTDRITKDRLEKLCAVINATFGKPEDAYTKNETGCFRAVHGVFTLDFLGGGRVGLMQVCNEGGGLRGPFAGYGSKRETWDEMQAFLKGAEMMRAYLKPEFLFSVNCRELGAQGAFEDKNILIRAANKADASRAAIEKMNLRGFECRHASFTAKTGN